MFLLYKCSTLYRCGSGAEPTPNWSSRRMVNKMRSQRSFHTCDYLTSISCLTRLEASKSFRNHLLQFRQPHLLTVDIVAAVLQVSPLKR